MGPGVIVVLDKQLQHPSPFGRRWGCAIRRHSSSIRCAGACSLDFSTSSNVRRGMIPLARLTEPMPASTRRKNHERGYLRRRINVLAAAGHVRGDDDDSREQDGRRHRAARVPQPPAQPPDSPEHGEGPSEAITAAAGALHHNAAETSCSWPMLSVRRSRSAPAPRSGGTGRSAWSG